MAGLHNSGSNPLLTDTCGTAFLSFSLLHVFGYSVCLRVFYDTPTMRHASCSWSSVDAGVVMRCFITMVEHLMQVSALVLVLLSVGSLLWLNTSCKFSTSMDAGLLRGKVQCNTCGRCATSRGPPKYPLNNDHL